MLRWLVPLFLVVPGMAVSGCVCEPESVDGHVVLTMIDEEVRTLPVLASGAWEVAGISAPDSHGRLEFDVDHTDSSVGSFDVRDLMIEVRVGGRVVPVVATHFEGFSPWHESDGLYDGRLRTGRDLVVWWTVDRDRIQDLEDLRLGAGSTYEVSMDFEWEVDTCNLQGSGGSDVGVSEHVRDSVVSQSFRVAGGPDFTKLNAATSFSLDLEIKNGIDTRVDSGMAALLGLTEGTGVPAIAVWDSLTTTVDGLPGKSVEPGQTLRVSGEAKPYTASDSAFDILVVWLDHDPEDGTAGLSSDLFAFVVDPNLA